MAVHELMSATGFLAGEGEMARRIRAHDWAAAPLGAPEAWPSTLKAMVRMALTTGHPVFIFWGPQHICLYNDAYRESLGPEKHPAILGMPGREAWAEIWPIIGPQIDQVLSGSGPTWHENQLVPIVRHGALQDVYWTYSYGPIDDERSPNGIGGVLVLCTETTAQVMTERRLKAEHERFAQLFEQAPTFMTMLRGPEHVIELVNPGYMSLVGHRPVLGRTVAEALPEAVAQGYVELLDSVYRSGQAYAAIAAKFSVLAADGGSASERYLDFVYQPISDAAGEIVGIFVVGVDVTERQAMEGALHVSEAQLRLVLDASEIGLWEVDNIADTTSWQPRVKAMFGIAADAPVTLADYYNGLHPDDRDATIAAFQAAADPAQRLLYDVEYRTVGQSDGVVRWVAAKGRGLFDDQGRCTRLLGTAMDITQRKQDETRLRELNGILERRVAESSAERRILADIVENTDAFVQVVGLDATWLAVNRAAAEEFERLFGKRPVVGARALDVLAGRPEHVAQISGVWQRALGGEVFTAIGEFTAMNGARHSYEMRFRPLYDEAGLRVGAYQFAYDITARLQDQERLARAEAALRQAQKMEAVGQLTGGIAHDFNNLLQAVRGNFELIRRKPENVEHVVRIAGKGLEVTTRGAKLTAQLLTFSREQALELRPVGIVPLLVGMEDLLRTTVGPTVRLALALPEDEVAALADATQLEMAVLNLAINARDAMPEGGELTVSVRARRLTSDAELPPNEYVELRVADTGAGMPPEVAARAFDPFFTTKAIGKGSGLGLSQVYGMAQRAGGTARIETPPGQGTTVVMLLPRCVGAPAEPVLEPAASGDAATASTLKVLVVDDDADVRSVIAAAFDALGYAVIEASDGFAGVAAVHREHVDAMVVDFAMPGMNGAEVARLARQRRPDLPILFVSGYSDTAAIDQAVGKGSTVLRKPFGIDALQQLFGEVMARKSRA